MSSYNNLCIQKIIVKVESLHKLAFKDYAIKHVFNQKQSGFFFLLVFESLFVNKLK